MRALALLAPVLASLVVAAAGCTGEMVVDRAVDPDPGGPDGGGSPADGAPAGARAVLAEWSGCMTLASWQTSGMSSWAQKVTEGATVCSSCHGDGLARVYASTDDQAMFEMNRYEVFITGFFTLASDGALEVVPAYDKLAAVAGGAGDHPTFLTGESDPAYQALASFHQLTRAARDAGTCGPAEFPVP